MRILLVLLATGLPLSLAAANFAYPFSFSPKYQTGEVYMGIRLLGALKLSSVNAKGELVSELSDLAWDQDAELLYAISDEGALFSFRPTFADGVLSDLDFVSKNALRGPSGKRLTGVDADAEGLDLKNARNGVANDTELLVSFERNHRLWRYDTNGQYLGEIALPKLLQDDAVFRTPNKGLEAFSYHPDGGWITGAEWPLQKDDLEHHTLFSASGKHAKVSRYPARRSAVVALEKLPSNDVLMLERSFDPSTAAVVIALRKLPNPKDWSSQKPLPTETLAEFNSFGDWHVDNFEGLTHHQQRRYFMVSDDNENLFQKTLLLYFEVVSTAPKE
ncbi:MAG: esterase-like activity of phytase family protein [Pseudomonadota bacterium]